MDEIQTHSKPVIEHCHREFLLQNPDAEEREYPDAEDQIREVLIHGNYLSQKDIEICRGFDLQAVADDPGIEEIHALHAALAARYGADDASGARALGTEGSDFEVGLWPGEGIPVVVGTGHHIALSPSPLCGAQKSGVLEVPDGAEIRYDSTRFQTAAPETVHVIANAVIRGRGLGPIRYLSLEQYYSGGFRHDSITVTPPGIIEYLQYRAEGTCFVRVANRVYDADPCPIGDTTSFRVKGEPVTLWWIYARSATAAELLSIGV